ncbi:MAG TPA: hypothetical protein VGB54_08925 [Allosphingosinicella sp.]
MNALLLLFLAFAKPQAAPPAQSVIAAERAFAARAQSEGQWTAFRATAAPDAIMLAPDPINAHQFLARFRSDPPVAVMWWPARVWLSCDGSLAVTSGPWVRRGGTQIGSFTTVWKEQDDRSWRWVYDNGRELPRAIDAPDEPATVSPYCREQPRRLDPEGLEPRPLVQFEGRAPGEGADALPAIPDAAPVASGSSRDRSLRWDVVRLPDQGPHAYAFRLFVRTRNNEHLALIEFHGLGARPSS